MECRTFDSAEAFLSRTAAFFQDREAENTILLGAVRVMGEAPETGDLLMAVEAEGRVRLAAARRPPHGFIVSHGDIAALPCLIEAVQSAGLALGGVVGPAVLCEAFAKAWAGDNGQTAAPQFRLTLYALSQVTLRKPVPGRLCQAATADIDWLAEWLAAILPEVGLIAEGVAACREQAARRVAKGEFHFWQVDGRPVSIASCLTTAPAGDGGRINLVYTPPEARAKGYASACVGALSQRLLDQGWRTCLIMADQTNPASNRIYERLGYRASATLQVMRFTEAG